MRIFFGFKKVIFKVQISFILVLLFFCGTLYGKNEKINVAVFDFEIKDTMLKSYEGKIASLLTSFISNENNINVVEREKIDKLIEEMESGKSGLINQNNVAQIGKIAGANAIITGKVFVLDDEIIITSKLISIETAIVYSSVVRGNNKSKMSDIVIELSKKIISMINQKYKQLVIVPNLQKNILKNILKNIKNKKLPTIGVYVNEKDIGEYNVEQTCENEIKFFLKKTGFKIMMNSNKKLKNILKLYSNDRDKNILSHLKGIDVLILGEAFSEFAIRKNNLVVCKARIELQVINTENNALLLVDRITESGIDLSRQIAGKFAIQNGTAKLMKKIIPELIKKWESELKK
jgi:TolB-like protein